MRYSFNDFIFDSERLLLSKQNDIIACRPNEAKLLALFLAEPQTVFSKDDILDRVWSGKVVSEQAVFQSISNLRNILGEGAIRTFPKKGYQWQLEVCLIDSSTLARSFDAKHVSADPVASSNQSINYLGFILLAMAVLVVAALLHFLNKPQSEAVKVAVLPLLIDSQNHNSPELQAELIEPLWSALLNTDDFQVVEARLDEDYRDFFYLPKKYFHLVSQQTKSPSIMVGAVGARKDKVFIRYILKKHRDQWIAEIEANTPAQLIEKWLNHLAHITHSGFVAADTIDPVLMNAELKLLQHNYPEDLVIIYRFVQSQLSLGDSTQALLLAEQLRDKAQQQNDNLYIGYALLAWGNGLRQQQLLDDAEKKLQQALDLFRSAQNYRMASEVQQALGYVAFERGSFEQMKAWDLQAMESARLAGDFLLEVQLNEGLAVRALKFGYRQETEYFLKQAEALLDKNNQSREHYAMIYFYSGMSAVEPSSAEYNYRRILSVTPDDTDLWVRERAQAHLVQLLIEQQRWQDAFAIYAHVKSLSAPQEFMMAKIYGAKQEWDKAEEYSVAAFKQANNKGDRNLALDAALSLIAIYQQKNQPEKQILYKNFIVRESTNLLFWQKHNQTALDQFAIHLPKP